MFYSLHTGLRDEPQISDPHNYFFWKLWADSLAALTTVPTITSIVVPTSPRTILLAMKGMSAIEIENRMLARAKRSTCPEPQKLFRMPLEFSTALRLPILTAVMRAWMIP